MILRQLDKHKYIRRFDAQEGQFYNLLDNMVAHINNQPPYDNNPHNLVAGQIARSTAASWWDHTTSLQSHTDNKDIHVYYALSREVKTGSNVSSKQLILGNTRTIVEIRVYVNGRKMIEGIDFHLSTKVLPNATLIFDDPDFPEGNGNVNIEIEYRQYITV